MKRSDVLTFCSVVSLIFACSVNVMGAVYEKVGKEDTPTEFPISLEIEEPGEILIEMGSKVPIMLNYTIACPKLENVYTLSVRSSNILVFEVKGNTTFDITCEDATEIDLILSMQNVSETEKPFSYTTNNSAPALVTQGSIIVDINGILLGIESMHIQLKNGGHSTSSDATGNVSDSVIAERRFTVGVLRPMTLVDIVFRIVIGVAVSLVLLGFGCGLNLEVVKECLKKPIAPGIGLGCQYILMPLIGFTVAKLVPIDNGAITFGIFICGVCPGGGISNFYAYLLNGDVDLSITMTLISSVAALGLLPMWVYTLGRQFVDEEFQIFIPYATMLQTLAMITIPLFIGVLLKYKFPKAAIKFVKILKPITIVIMLVVVVTGVISNMYIFQLFRPEYLFAGALLPYCGYILGGITAAILRQPWVRVKTIALETGMQNVGVAFIMMMMSFPQPLGDIAMLAPAASAMMTPIPPMLITIPYLIYKRCTRDYDAVSALTDAEIDVRKDGGVKEDTKHSNEKKAKLDSGDDKKPMISDKLTSV